VYSGGAVTGSRAAGVPDLECTGEFRCDDNLEADATSFSRVGMTGDCISKGSDAVIVLSARVGSLQTVLSLGRVTCPSKV
jgi:hypothetical protein